MPFFLLLLAFNSSLWAQGTIGVQAAPKKTEVPLAQPVEILYTIRLPAGLKLDLSSWKTRSSQWGDFVLWDFKTAQGQDNGSSIINLTLFLMPFTLGETQIPAIEIPAKSDGSAITVIKTPPVSLKILDPTQGAPGAAAGLKDIKPPRKPLYFWENPWFWIPSLIILLAGLLGYAFLWRKLRQKKRQARIAAEELLPPEEQFTGNLNNLMESGLLAKGSFREFHFALSEIFKQYLNRRFSMDIESLTTNELLRLLHKERQVLGIELNSLIAIKEGLEIMDLAKFAKYSPAGGENNKSIAALKRFVEANRPAPPAAQDQEKKLEQPGFPLTRK